MQSAKENVVDVLSFADELSEIEKASKISMSVVGGEVGRMCAEMKCVSEFIQRGQCSAEFLDVMNVFAAHASEVCVSLFMDIRVRYLYMDICLALCGYVGVDVFIQMYEVSVYV